MKKIPWNVSTGFENIENYLCSSENIYYLIAGKESQMHEAQSWKTGISFEAWGKTSNIY